MTDDDKFGDASEVAVVPAADGNRRFGISRLIIIVVSTMLLGGAGYVLVSSRDGANSAVVARDDGAPQDETTTEVAVSTTEELTPFATLEPRTPESTTTTEVDTAGGPPASFSGCENRRLPSLVGIRPQDSGPRLAACGELGGTQGDFMIVTMSEPCAPDPSQVGLIASQSPSAGSNFGAPIVRIEVAVYQDCASTVPPTEFVPPYTFPSDWDPSTTVPPPGP